MTRVIALVLAAAAVAVGCGGSDEDGGDRTETVERTRVEVLERGDDREGGRFDAAALYRATGPGVVTIVSIFDADERSGNRLPIDPGGGDDEDGGGTPNGGVGSGFVVSGDGEIATNAHVVTSGEGKEIDRADKVYVRFADHNQVEAKIVGFDPNADVALLKLETREGLRLRPLPLGRTNDVRVGAPVIAIGSPFGEEQSLSVGVVSATDRAIQSLTGFDTLGAVQTDAAINQGNSGGPLIDADGEVIGINAQIRTRSGGGEGVGYAIPVDQVRRSVEQIREDGKVRYAYLGVATTAVYPQLAERFDLGTKTGAWVQEVVKDGPGAKAGLKVGGDEVRFQERPYRRGGDIITRIDDTPVRTETDLGIAVARYEPGAEVTLEIVRGGERREVKVRLGERPAETGQRRP